MDERDNLGPTTQKNNKDKTQYNALNNNFSIINSKKDPKNVKTNLFRTQDIIHRNNKVYYVDTIM